MDSQLLTAFKQSHKLQSLQHNKWIGMWLVRAHLQMNFSAIAAHMHRSTYASFPHFLLKFSGKKYSVP